MSKIMVNFGVKMYPICNQSGLGEAVQRWRPAAAGNTAGTSLLLIGIECVTCSPRYFGCG
jgi:hypothetical protein